MAMPQSICSQTDVERQIVAARDRQKHADLMCQPDDHELYTAEMNRWLDLWRPARSEGHVLI